MTGHNYHMHSIFSDGKNPPLDYVVEALWQNMTSIGFSDHAPMPFENTFSIQPFMLEVYNKEIRDLKQKYEGQIDIYHALEIDYIPGILDNFEPLINACQLDYSIGSVHLVGKGAHENLWFIDGPLVETYDSGVRDFFGSNIRKAVKAFYDQTNEMIVTQNFDVLGHFDKIKMHNQNRFFQETEPWYQDLVKETLRLVKEKNLYVELNTRGKYKLRCDGLFPSSWILNEMHDLGIQVIVSSDAHQPNEIQLLFVEAIKALKTSGYTDMMVLERGKWISTPLP